MLDYTNFDEVFGSPVGNPYNKQALQEIETFRKGSDGVLFIDRVLNALGLSKAKSYPPKNDTALRNLHKTLCEADISTHHRLSIFYYLLLDTDGHDNRAQFSTRFANASGVPKNYQIFMKGLWLLDHHKFERALEHVTHPSLTPDFADEIVTTFARNNPTLALAYFHTVQPVLKTRDALELLFNALALASVTEALAFSRTHPAAVREQLFRRLVSSVLDAQAGDDTARRAIELAGLSLDADEEAWLETYLLEGDGKRLKNAQDTLLMRKLATGRYTEAVKEKGLGGRWGVVIEGLKSGIGGRTL
ncbi:hypothetical protein BN1723_001137 [Verticillium longisporum]|nr:Protein ELYS like protein [Verticillium longisporum]CRK45794.1 hypothetical protein BN1723_001137 [Verticillium longisporum]